MSRIAVVAHTGKTLGGGLGELRTVLGRYGVTDPLWLEVDKSRKAPKAVRKALAAGADHVLVWGGDGTCQRCVDVLAGRDATMSILPAGTANLLATNLGIPGDLEQAVEVALHGEHRRIDVARLDGEGFAVMAGAGFDAQMIADADGRLKDRLGRAAYVLTGARNLRIRPFEATVVVDGERFYTGPASCILIGNVGKLFAGVAAFAGAEPDDGLLEVGVVTADGAVQWLRTLARAALGDASKSPFAHATKGRDIRLKFDRKVRYELDGGDREKVRKLHVTVEPGALTVCVPPTAAPTQVLADSRLGADR
jgi:YegS/Rv2252/BmrU family lipid kinase